VRAIDTNLLVRLVARDDPEQLRTARAVIAGGDVLVLPTVLLEAEWVLRSRYAIPRQAIVDGLTTILSQSQVTLVSSAPVASALTAYAQGGDFADLLHLALASEAGASVFVTFDRAFAELRAKGPELQIL
jgi:predicted nucleic-acid-binding protein